MIDRRLKVGDLVKVAPHARQRLQSALKTGYGHVTKVVDKIAYVCWFCDGETKPLHFVWLERVA